MLSRLLWRRFPNGNDLMILRKEGGGGTSWMKFGSRRTKIWSGSGNVIGWTCNTPGCGRSTTRLSLSKRLLFRLVSDIISVCNSSRENLISQELVQLKIGSCFCLPSTSSRSRLRPNDAAWPRSLSRRNVYGLQVQAVYPSFATILYVDGWVRGVSLDKRVVKKFSPQYSKLLTFSD